MSEDDDISVDEGELSYFTDKRSYSFLQTNLELDKPSKKLKSTEDVYAEKRYKKEKLIPQQDVHYMLPIKTDKGLKERSRVIEKVKPVEDPVKTIVQDVAEVAPSSVSELYTLRQKYIAAAKQDIAKLCCAIIEDPYNNLPAMKKLRNYCTTEDSKAGQTVRKLAIISLTAVYNDILPTYRVKPTSDLDVLSKDVKVQHSYETDLLRNYQIFLDLLLNNMNNAFQSKKKDKIPEDALTARRNLGLLSLKSMCELLASNYAFNLRSNIIAIIVPYGTSKIMKGALSQIVIATIKELFDKDEKGECSVEIVRIIASLVKKNGASVNPKLLETFLEVRLVELGEAKKRKQEDLPDTALLSKKQRKHRKEQAKVRKEMLEAEAVESKEKQGRLQAESLDHIFVTYFRILKQYHNSVLLTVALSGLSKFAHLINVDFFTDLFICLQKIVHEEDLNMPDSLNCVSTIFTILSGQGSVLDVDIGGFYSLLYQKILHFTVSTPISTYRLLQRTLANALKRKVPVLCQMAMAKRLCIMATHLMPEQSNIMLAEARKLMRSQPRVAHMLATDNEFGRPYFPEATEPGQANADGTVLWEVSSLATKSYHETVRKTAKHVCNYDPSSTKKSELEHFMKKSFAENGTFHILEDTFPEKCKKMQNRRIKLPDNVTASSSNSVSSDKIINFYDSIGNKTKASRIKS